MSFNIRYDNNGDNKNKWVFRKEFVRDVILKY
jgi:hypothetical protein